MSRQRSLIFWPVPLRSDREHSWKHHARSGSLLYELLGWIDVMAARKEAEKGVRFVFAKRETLLTKCFKGKRTEGKHYHIRKLDAALAELREQHIISKYLETADHKWCGFVVAPHHSLCHKERNGKTCLLPDRSIQFPDPDFPVANWRQRVLAAVKTAAIGQHKGSQNGSDRAVITAVNTAVVPAIDGSQNGSQNGSDQSLYDANFALLTESEKADWLANGMQDGPSTRCTRGSLLADEPAYPSYPSAQDELKRHEQFLRSKTEKQKPEQVTSAVVSEVVLSGEPKTAEAKPKAMQPGRKRDVLSEEEHERAKIARAAREAFAMDALPLCPHCGLNHLGDGCQQPPPPKRKRS